MSARLPDDLVAGSPGACRLTPSRELGGSLAVTVESRQLLNVRRAIVRSGCEHARIVRATPLAGGTRVRMLIALEPGDLARVMDAIMSEVSSGEFGNSSTRKSRP